MKMTMSVLSGQVMGVEGASGEACDWLKSEVASGMSGSDASGTVN